MSERALYVSRRFPAKTIQPTATLRASDRRARQRRITGRMFFIATLCFALDIDEHAVLVQKRISDCRLVSCTAAIFQSSWYQFVSANRIRTQWLHSSLLFFQCHVSAMRWHNRLPSFTFYSTLLDSTLDPGLWALGSGNYHSLAFALARAYRFLNVRPGRGGYARRNLGKDRIRLGLDWPQMAIRSCAKARLPPKSIRQMHLQEMSSHSCTANRL